MEEKTIIKRISCPRFSIQKSENTVKILYEKFKTKDFDKEQLSEALKLSPTSSHTDTLIGNLISYGLIEPEQKRYKITRRGKILTLSETEEDKNKELENCFNEINSYREIFKNKQISSWTEHTLFIYLISEYEISDRVAKEYVSALYESYKYLRTLGIDIESNLEDIKKLDAQENIPRIEQQKTQQANKEIIKSAQGFYLSFPIGSGKMELSLSKQIEEHSTEDLTEIKEVLEFFISKINKRISTNNPATLQIN